MVYKGLDCIEAGHEPHIDFFFFSKLSLKAIRWWKLIEIERGWGGRIRSSMIKKMHNIGFKAVQRWFVSKQVVCLILTMLIAKLYLKAIRWWRLIEIERGWGGLYKMLYHIKLYNIGFKTVQRWYKRAGLYRSWSCASHWQCLFQSCI